MIGYTLLGGYLGAGKTTLLNHILTHNEGRRLGLLINDFGDINIDARLIQSRAPNQINLANGCICCSLTDGFFEALEQLQKASPQPDHILVEASGVADVRNLAQYGHGHHLRLSGVVVLADAQSVRQKCRDKYVGKTLQRQLAAADLIVLNKTDLVDDETATELNDWLRVTYPEARTLPAVRAELPLAIVLDIDARTQKDAHVHAHHESYLSWSFQREGVFCEAQLAAFLQALGTEVLRAKGIFPAENGGSYELQLVGGRKELTRRTDALGTRAELVAIGLREQLDPARLDRDAARYLAQ